MFVFTKYVSGLNQFSAKGQAGHGFVETLVITFVAPLLNPL
jgi:hypothetical protein